MGVKELWTVLSPISEKKPLWELKNKSIAIDLSAWICDSQNVGDNSQRNMYLRNLFFRTSFLLLLGAKPVFVLEGAAPELKHKTIIARSQARNGNKDVAKSSSRANLKTLQKQCEKLLKTMGISCVQGTGEAEAYCAWLNSNDIVDAVITQDSDCFLYGAKTIYRNFTMSPTYTCDVYSIPVIENKLNLGRNKLLALSLLCGCDYDKGVNGVGKESALKFLSTLEEHEVLDRLRSWRNNSKYDLMEKKEIRNLSPELKLELTIRKKALQIPDFPSEEIIEEYLSNQSIETAPLIGWLQPDLLAFLKIADKQLTWDEQYAIEKFFPLMTRWHLLYPTIHSFVRCETILKKRVVRGMNSYECRWAAPELTLGETNVVLVTTEPQDLVYSAYKDLVEEYLNSKTKKTKKGIKPITRKKKSDKENIPTVGSTNIEKLLHNLSIDDDEKGSKVKDKQPNKKRVKNILTNCVVPKGVQTLDKYLKPQTDKQVISELNINEQLDELSKMLIGSPSKTDCLVHSTPKRTTTAAETICPNIADSNVSYHYNSDFSHSPSPLKHKFCASVNRRSAALNEKSTLRSSTDFSEEWSLSNYLTTRENKGINENPMRILDESMTASFLNVTKADDDFNMSDIVDSIVNNKGNGAISNPAIKILRSSNHAC